MGGGGGDNGERIAVHVDAALERLIPPFLARRWSDVNGIAEALAEGDLSTVATIGHRMKGSGGSMGFDRITEIGAAIEDAANVADRATIQAQRDALHDYLERIDVVYE